MTSTTKIHHQNLLSQLNKIGIKNTDAEIYLTSLRLGACTINQLTKQTNINRITVHDSVARLLEKGLLLETYSGKRRLIFPEQINNLQHLVDRKKAETEQLQHDVSTTIGLLQSIQHQSDYLPKVRIMKGRTGIEELTREIKEETNGPLWTITDSWHFDELLNVHALEKLVNTKTHRDIKILLPAGFEHFIFSAKAKGLNITTRNLPDNSQRKGGMTIRSNKIALHAYEGVYITTTIIENAAITAMMQSCYQALWDQAK